MDPCPFVRILVGNIALKYTSSSSSTNYHRPSPPTVGVHPSPTPCFCKIRLNKLPYQTSDIPHDKLSPSVSNFSLAAVFDLSNADLARLAAKPLLFTARRPHLKLVIYAGASGATCGVKHGRLLGKVSVPIDLKDVDENPSVIYDEWTPLGKSEMQVHVTVRTEPDPRFVFEFGGEPECSPQVFQVQGSMRQPVFTCKFTFRSQSERCPSSRGWLGSFGSIRERPGKERKGWAVTVHDLSGSPVAMASMVTPFVASPGTDRVGKTNPGAWLILRPGDNTWKPWGRLEAWRVRGGIGDSVGYRFELLPDANSNSSPVLVAESTLSTHGGGKFVVDKTGTGPGPKAVRTLSRSTSPGCSPRCLSGRFSGHFGHDLWPFYSYKGFVMSSKVEGEGRCSKPTVEIGVRNVGCAEDAAVFIALAAAVDLSMDACRLFSHKLRKELCQHHDFLV